MIAEVVGLLGFPAKGAVVVPTCGNSQLTLQADRDEVRKLRAHETLQEAKKGGLLPLCLCLQSRPQFTWKPDRMHIRMSSHALYSSERSRLLVPESRATFSVSGVELGMPFGRSTQTDLALLRRASETYPEGHFSQYKLDEYCCKDLIAYDVSGPGRSRTRQYDYPLAIDQLVALERIAPKYRNLDERALVLWVESYRPDPAAVKLAYRHVFGSYTKYMRHAAQIFDDGLSARYILGLTVRTAIDDLLRPHLMKRIVDDSGGLRGRPRRLVSLDTLRRGTYLQLFLTMKGASATPHDFSAVMSQTVARFTLTPARQRPRLLAEFFDLIRLDKMAKAVAEAEPNELEEALGAVEILVQIAQALSFILDEVQFINKPLLSRDDSLMRALLVGMVVRGLHKEPELQHWAEDYLLKLEAQVRLVEATPQRWRIYLPGELSVAGDELTSQERSLFEEDMATISQEHQKELQILGVG